MHRTIHLVLPLTLAALVACDRSPSSQPAATGSKTAQSHDHDHDHAHDHDHDHGHGEGSGMAGHGSGHHGPAMELGTLDLEGLAIHLTRDEGAIVAGGDAAIDATITGAEPLAVRFWIGSRDGRGSTKARATIEDPHEPNRWHTHVEIPSPLPDGAQLWIEVELEGGVKRVGGVDLKAG